MENKINLTVKGYTFQYEEDAELAREEIKKIAFLEQRIDLHVKENVISVYQKALDTKTFVTPVGWEYMIKLRNTLIHLGMKPEDIPPMPLYTPFSAKAKEEPIKQRIKTAPKASGGDIYKSRWHGSLMIILLLVIMVFTMFVITIKSSHPNILNYETAILNKYAAWEQDLSERERAVKQKEIELKMEPGDSIE